MNDISLLDVAQDASELSALVAAPTTICVCCNCDRIRTRSGELGQRSDAPARRCRTHGICPECFAVLYPEFASLGVR